MKYVMCYKIWFFWFFSNHYNYENLSLLVGCTKAGGGPELTCGLWLADPCSRVALYPWPPSDIGSRSALNHYWYTGSMGMENEKRSRGSALVKELKDTLKRNIFLKSCPMVLSLGPFVPPSSFDIEMKTQALYSASYDNHVITPNCKI